MFRHISRLTQRKEEEKEETIINPVCIDYFTFGGGSVKVEIKQVNKQPTGK